MLLTDYNQAFETVLTFLMKSDIIESIKAIACLGSYNDQEIVEGWSDLDILLIVESDAVGNIDINVVKNLDRIHSDIAEDFPNLEISFLPHTLHDLENYVTYSYLRTYQFAQTFYPRNDKFYIKRVIENIVQDRNLRKSIIKRIHIYDLRHLRFNLLRKVISEKDFQQKARLLVDELVRSTILILGIYDRYEQSKEKRAQMVKEYIKNTKLQKLLVKMVDYRRNWNSLKENDYLKIYEEGLLALQLLGETFNEYYPYSTPEELININE